MLPRIERQSSALCLLVSIVLGTAGCATRAVSVTAASAPSDWSRVDGLPEGAKVVVDRHGSTAVAGSTLKITANSIELATSAGSAVIDRSDVRRVVRTKSRAGKRVVWGMAIGGVGGVLQGLLLTESNQLLFARLFGAGWAAIGGTIGGLSGIGASETIVVYEASASHPELPNHQMQPTRRATLVGARLIWHR